MCDGRVVGFRWRGGWGKSRFSVATTRREDCWERRRRRVGRETADWRSALSTESAYAGPTAGGKTFFGHPRGLATLFFTEMWERFSYYGMRALLTLFMTTATFEANPGLGLDVATAGAVYGLYTSLVYILALPGGWVADNLWGQRKAIWVGGWIIAAGHFTMAVPSNFTFFLGLVFIICGTGLLKPNVSTVVGELYPEGGARRDAGFSIYYMGINLGALAGPAVTGFLGEGYSWHWGFGAAGVGMLFGLYQFRLGSEHLGDLGFLKTDQTDDEVSAMSRRFFGTFGAVAAAVTAFGYLVYTGVIGYSITQIASALGYSVLIIVALYFVYLWTRGGHTAEENKKMFVIFWLFPPHRRLLVRVRAGRNVAQPIRARPYRSDDLRLADAGVLPAVDQSAVYRPHGSRLRDVVGRPGEPSGGPVDSDEGGDGLGGPRSRVLCALLGGCERIDGQPGVTGLAYRHLLLPYSGRAVHLADRLIRDHEALAGTPGGPDDGHLVRRSRAGQSVRGPRGRPARDDDAYGPLPYSRDDHRRSRHRRARGGSPGQEVDRRRALGEVWA